MKREILLNWRIYFAAPLVVAFLHASLNYSGFCFREMRYLSDEEKFQIVFDAFDHRDTVIIIFRKENTVSPKSYEQIKYESFEQFMKMNPYCCTILPGKFTDRQRESWLSYFWNRITGYDSGRVIVGTFTLHYLDEKGEQRSQEITTEYVLQNCGKRRGS